jgi:phosphoserine phosphatase
LITNGIEQVAGVVAERLGITEWYGNTVEIKDKTVTGRFCSSPLLALCSKGDLVRDMVVQRSSKRESAAVGNDVNDWPMFEEVDISILFNPSPYLKKHLQWCVKRGEKGFKKECIAYSRCVDIVIKERDLRLLLPFLLPHLIEKGEKNVLFAANYSLKR